MNMKMIDGGVTAAKGFLAAGGAAGIKKNGSDDIAIIYAEVPCVSAGTFTTNRVKAAPVIWDRELVRGRTALLQGDSGRSRNRAQYSGKRSLRGVDRRYRSTDPDR